MTPRYHKSYWRANYHHIVITVKMCPRANMLNTHRDGEHTTICRNQFLSWSGLTIPQDEMDEGAAFGQIPSDIEERAEKELGI